MYRRRLRGSTKFNERMARARAAREQKRLDGPPPDYPPELPILRRRIVVEDYDMGETVRHEFLLYRTRRIDSYRLEVDGKLILRRVGWARTLDLCRKAFLRVRGSLQ